MHNEEKNIKALFANARGQLIGMFGPVIGALVTITVISVLASYIPLLVSKNTDF